MVIVHIFFVSKNVKIIVIDQIVSTINNFPIKKNNFSTEESLERLLI